MPQASVTPNSTPNKTVLKFRPIDLVKDIDPPEVPPEFWTSVFNFHSRQGYARRIDGNQIILGQPLFAPMNVINTPSGPSNFWVYGGEDGIGVVDQGAIHTDITSPLYPVSVQPGEINTTLINGFPILSFGGIPVFWDLQTSSNFADLPGWPANTTCKAIRSSRQFLFALGMIENGVVLNDKLRWSNSAEAGSIPTEWDATPENDSGDTILSATSGEIVDGLGLRGQFIIYKSHSTYNANFTGGTFVWAFRKLFSTTGMLANNCVAEAFGTHYVLTDGDFIRHDGQNIVSLVDRKVRRFIFSQLDPTNFKNCFVFNNRSKKEIWAAVVPNGEEFATFAIVYSYATEQISIRDIPVFSHAASGIVLDDTAVSDTWDAQVDSWQTIAREWDQATFTPAFEEVLGATPDDGTSTPPANEFFTFVDKGSTTVNGDTIPARIARESLDFDMPNTFKHIKRMWPRIEANPGTIILVRVGVQTTSDSSISWRPALPFIAGTTDSLFFDVSGRFISFEFLEDTSQPAQTAWAVNGFEVEFNLQGQYD